MADPGQRLADALAHHRAGQLDQALAGYRAVLDDKPDSADAHHLIGLALDQKGEHEAAVAAIEQAIALKPASGLFRFNLARVLSEAGQVDRARETYRAAIDMKPGDADAHSNLGLLEERAGSPDAALAAFEAALAVDPGHLKARVNLARTLITLKRSDAAASHLKHLTSLPDAPAEAWFLTGTLAEDAERFDDAIAAYRRALDIAPDFEKARNNLGTALLGAQRYGEARQVFNAIFAAKRGDAGADAGTFSDERFPARANTRLRTCRYRLSDSADQIDYLITNDLLDPSWTAAAQRYRDAIAALDRAFPADRPVVLEGQEADALADLHDRAIRVADTAPLAGPAIGQENDYAAIEDAYLAAATSITTIDGFLSPEALNALRAYCRQSTIFFGHNATGYVTSYMADGFACSLLYTIAEELQAAMPRVLGSRPLHNMWVYRHANHGGGVDAHTDDASVTFNFWITEADANLDPEHGGLIVYQREQPLDWDWVDMNLRKNEPDVKARYAAFLAEAPEVRLPYGENRAILFHSNLLHKSDRLTFKEGFDQRRMNVTLLFGERGS